MRFPAKSKVQSKARGHTPVVLEIGVVLYEGTDIEGSVSPLAVTGARPQEEVGILITGIWLGAVVRSGGRIVNARGLVGIRNLVHRAVRQVGEMLLPDPKAKGELVFAPNFVQVLVERRYPLAHARSEERRVGKEGRSRWAPYH